MTVPLWFIVVCLLGAPVCALTGAATGAFITLAAQGRKPLAGVGEAVARRFGRGKELEPEKPKKTFTPPRLGA
jgi:hypothetical protein